MASIIVASPPYPHPPSSSLASSSASSSSSSTMLTRCCSYRPCFPIGAMLRRGASARHSWGAADPPRIRRKAVGRWRPVLSPKANKSRQTNPTSDKRRAAFPFRTATVTGAADATSRPLARRMSVWVSSSYCRRQEQEHHQQQQHQHHQYYQPHQQNQQPKHQQHHQHQWHHQHQHH